MAYHESTARKQQMEIAEQNVAEAVESLESNLERILGLVGLPIEAVQAVRAIADARNAYIDAVIRYNQSQLRLWRAIGRSPQA